MARLLASTSPLWANAHQGSPLPAARVVVVGVPAAAFLVYYWLTHRKEKR